MFFMAVGYCYMLSGDVRQMCAQASVVEAGFHSDKECYKAGLKFNDESRRLLEEQAKNIGEESLFWKPVQACIDDQQRKEFVAKYGDGSQYIREQ